MRQSVRSSLVSLLVFVLGAMAPGVARAVEVPGEFVCAPAVRPLNGFRAAAVAAYLEPDPSIGALDPLGTAAYERCFVFVDGAPIRIVGKDTASTPPRIIGIRHTDNGQLARLIDLYATSTDHGATWELQLGTNAHAFLPGDVDLTPEKMIIEVAYSYSCHPLLAYKFAYTKDGRIFRSTFPKAQPALEAWVPSAWAEVPQPEGWDTLQMTGRPGNFLVHNGAVYIGNYTQPAPGAPDVVGAHVWKLSNCAGTQRSDWLEVLNLSGEDPPGSGIRKARHVHAIGGDPENPSHVYVSVGDGNPKSGLHRLSPNMQVPSPLPVVEWLAGNRYGINMAFPPTYNPPMRGASGKKVLLEGDGPSGPHLAAYQKSFSLFPGSIDALVWPEDIPADGDGPVSTCAAVPPQEPDAHNHRQHSWAGSGAALGLTAEGDAFYVTSGENGCIGTRDGVWLARGPHFTRAVLLEDLTRYSEENRDTTNFVGQLGKTYQSGGRLFNSYFALRVPRFKGKYLPDGSFDPP